MKEKGLIFDFEEKSKSDALDHEKGQKLMSGLDAVEKQVHDENRFENKPAGQQVVRSGGKWRIFPK